MERPHSIATAVCPTCEPWTRWIRSGSGAFARQEQHEQTCTVFPKVQRRDAAHAAGMSR